MKIEPVVHNTFVVERTYSNPPEAVFAYLSDPSKKRRWFADEANHEVEAFKMDFRPGGTELFRYRFKPGTRFEGMVLVNSGIYLDIVPGARIVSASSMAFGDHPFSASLITFELVGEGDRTKLICTHQGAFLEGADGPQIREIGWRTLLENLAREVDAS